jgi:hypothetical protein
MHALDNGPRPQDRRSRRRDVTEEYFLDLLPPEFDLSQRHERRANVLRGAGLANVTHGEVRQEEIDFSETLGEAAWPIPRDLDHDRLVETGHAAERNLEWLDAVERAAALAPDGHVEEVRRYEFDPGEVRERELEACRAGLHLRGRFEHPDVECGRLVRRQPLVEAFERLLTLEERGPRLVEV